MYCRCCLKNVQKHEKTTIINRAISCQFTNVTQYQLESSDHLSKVICEICLRSIQLAYALRTQFIENQRILLENDDSKLNEEPDGSGSDEREMEFLDVKDSESQFETEYVKEFLDEELLEDSFSFVKVDNEPKSDNHELKLIQHEPNSASSINQIDIKPPTAKNDPNLVTKKPKQLNIKKESSQHTEKPKRGKKKKEPKVPKKRTGRIYQGGICNYCNKPFSRMLHMLRHIDEYHKKIRFKCAVSSCEFVSARRERIKSHIHKRHSKLDPIEIEKMVELVDIMSPINET